MTPVEHKGLHNNLVFCKTINRDYDDRFARSGAKNGGTLLIRNPNEFTVRTGAVMDTQDVAEETQTLTIATQKGVDINFSSVELTLSLDDFADRILKPAMSRLAADVDATVIAALYPGVYNFENTTFGTKPVLADILASRAKLNQGLAPAGDRYAMVDSLAANSIITDSKALFHAASEVERQYSQGVLGTISGMKFHETEMTPTHTNGSRDDTTPVCNTSSGITSGSSTITTTGADGTMVVGDVFTIADVYAVNPETKVKYPHLQQFAILTAHTNDGTDDWEVTPTPVTSGARQNISLVSPGASKAIKNVAAGGSGTASAAYTNSLVFHKDAFTMVTADLEMPQGVDFAAREVYDGISLRVVRNFDIVNDKFPCRIDVLFGQLATRPEWACRMCS
jgi:hypothetical protein